MQEQVAPYDYLVARNDPSLKFMNSMEEQKRLRRNGNDVYSGDNRDILDSLVQNNMYVYPSE